MSGEAYQQLHQAWDLEQLMWVAREYVEGNEEEYNGSAREMIDRFRELGYEQVANETDALLKQIAKDTEWLTDCVDQIRPYWRALAWLDAGDTGLENFHKNMATGGR